MARRVGLLTLPLHKNFGGILQAAALYEYMTSEGFEVVLLERSARKTWRNAVAKRVAALPVSRGLSVAAQMLRHERVRALQTFVANHRFIDEFLPRRSGLLHDAGDMRRAIRTFALDAVVVGSDQVWRPEYLPPDSVADYFLGFAEGVGVRRISYAASFGHADWRYPDHTAEVTRLLSRFDAVGVREASGLDICRDLFGRADAVHVLDPTLLVSPGFYDRVADTPTARTDSVLFEYILDQDDDRASSIGQDVATSLAGKWACRSVSLDGNRPLPGIGGWVRGIMDADFVMTDSFHGMVFSIIFRKNFLAVVNHKRGADRFISLTRLLGLEDRLIDGRSREQARALAAQPIDYAAVTPRLEALREHSRAFLAAALGGAGT